MAAVIFFGAVSCAKEDISSSLAGGEVEVTFTANLPELGTRAYGDGANANLLRYWVYDANGEELPQLRGTATTTNRIFTFTLPLIKGMTYDFVLWADQNVGTVENPEGLYDVTDGIVTIDYTEDKVKANDNNRDAFYGFVEGFDPLEDTPEFTLIRPFAQINAATSEKMEDITANGLTLVSSSIKADAYTQFDIKARNVVGNSQKVTLAAALMPYMEKDENGNPAPNKLPGKETYTYLAMGYILAPQDRMLSDVTFYFKGKKSGADFTVGGAEGLSYTNVPLKQNYRTNILGQLLTKSTEIEVKIDPVYVDDFNWSVPPTVSTSAELVAALQTAVAAGETNIVFDANGANIGNFNKDDNTWFTTNLVPTGVTVTLRNATVSGISRWNNANGTLIFENCTFTNNSAYSINFGWGNGHVKFTNCELYGWCSFSGVTVEMNDCNIAGNGSYALVRSYNTFTMNNCTIDGSNAIKDDDYPDGVSIGDGAVLTMTGCTMTDAEYDYGESLIDGNRVVDYGENSSYIIVDGKRLVCNPSSLEYALKNGNAILMENNITVEAHLTNTSHGTNINIDGGGNELTLRGIYGVSGANVSLSNMTLVDSKTDDYTIFNQGGKIELNNVTYNSTINKAFQMAGGGDVVLTDCNISGDVTGTYSASNIWCGDGRNVTVNGGTYGSIFMNAQYHSGWPAASAHAASKITLNDGTITKLTLETELGAEGYYVSATLTQNGGTITNLVENPQNLDLTGRSQYNK